MVFVATDGASWQCIGLSFADIWRVEGTWAWRTLPTLFLFRAAATWLGVLGILKAVVEDRWQLVYFLVHLI